MASRYRLRLRRKRFLLRARRKRRELCALKDRTNRIAPDDILLFCTLRNERVRLPYFLDYYRAIGVNHFFFVDNGSDDGGADYLAQQPDVSLWRTGHSYRGSRFGMDWLNALLRRYGHGHWTLCVDADEFFIYPFCDTRPLRALTDWLNATEQRSFGAMLLDMYPKGALNAEPYREGENPFKTLAWFDRGNYTIRQNRTYWNLWIQGGVRARVFFPDKPEQAPSLNKIPLVKWRRDYVYLTSTHVLLPRDLNKVYDSDGGEKASGMLLHAKFLDSFDRRTAQEVERNEHYRNSREYRAYSALKGPELALWCPRSERYISWLQLETLGLMSKGSWA